MASRDTVGKGANTIRCLLDKRIGEMLRQLNHYITPVRIDLDGWKTLPCGYKTNNTVPDPDSGAWTDFPFGGRWGSEPEEHRWFYKKVVIPDELIGADIELYLSPLKLDESTWHPQLLVYIDGKQIQGHDSNHRYIKIDSSKKETDVHAYAYSSPDGIQTGWYPQLCVFNRDVERLYYNILTPYEVMGYLTEDDKEFVDIRTYLNNALNLVNWCEPMSEEFLASVKAANAYMESEFYGKYCGEQDIKVNCIGHSHIDVAWQWTLEQTKEKVQRTFGTVVELMKKYPDYKFISSQPQLYKYLKEEAPEIYAEVKQLVKEGRIEPEGSMWLEADCNLTSGESLVRQILFGKRFFRDEFGVDNKVVWLPDVFGYSAAMPQIMKKSGVDKFVTSKISWNESNRMPYDNFMWKGIDGTKVFATFLTSFYRNRELDFNRSFISDYNSIMIPQCVRGAWDRYEPKCINNEVMMTFGYGDGGGGPTTDMLERYDRLKRGIPGCPQVNMEFAGSFLERNQQKLEKDKRLPEWSGELYLEFHRGTYTSQAKTKKNNRKSEFLYQNAETAAAMAAKLTGAEYPQEKLNEGWESILLHQFHDI
ncbi:MAG: alpha-mannosidase, partial [Clostridia bacterium]|nr:alpha-mannosidase [Clostridia bacterium]